MEIQVLNPENYILAVAKNIPRPGGEI